MGVERCGDRDFEFPWTVVRLRAWAAMLGQPRPSGMHKYKVRIIHGGYTCRRSFEGRWARRSPGSSGMDGTAVMSQTFPFYVEGILSKSTRRLHYRYRDNEIPFCTSSEA